MSNWFRCSTGYRIDLDKVEMIGIVFGDKNNRRFQVWFSNNSTEINAMDYDRLIMAIGEKPIESDKEMGL